MQGQVPRLVRDLCVKAALKIHLHSWNKRTFDSYVTNTQGCEVQDDISVSLIYSPPTKSLHYHHISGCLQRMSCLRVPASLPWDALHPPKLPGLTPSTQNILKLSRNITAYSQSRTKPNNPKSSNEHLNTDGNHSMEMAGVRDTPRSSRKVSG